MRLSNISSESGYRWLSLGLFLSVVIFCLFTVRDYGMTWDEPFRFEGGDSKLNYYKNLFSGQPAGVQKSSYPGLFDLPLALVHDRFPDLGTRSQKGHIYSLFFGCLGLLAVWRTAARIGGERAGFFALLLLTTIPRYYGHMFFNPKDIPLAGTYALGVWALVVLFQNLPKPAWPMVAWVGLAAGLAMSTRIAGFLILVYFGAFVGLFLGCKYLSRFTKASAATSASSGAALLAEMRVDLPFWMIRGLVAGLVAIIPLAVFWPTLHSGLFESVGDSIETVQRYGWEGHVLMNGYFWEAGNLPFYYVPYWLLRTLPEPVLLLVSVFIAAGVFLIIRSLRTGRIVRPELLWPSCVLGCSALFPLLYLYWTDPVLYDGMRHYLFALPPLAAMSALGLEYLLRFLESAHKRKAALGLQVGVAASACIVAIEMVSLHPYQYVYFNHFSGGLEGAYMRDETDYWGASHKEAAEWLNAFVEAIGPDGGRRFTVHQPYSFWMLETHLNPNRFAMTPNPQGADFYVATTRFNFHTSYPEATLLHTVKRQGVPLCFVFAFAESEPVNATD